MEDLLHLFKGCDNVTCRSRTSCVERGGVSAVTAVAVVPVGNLRCFTKRQGQRLVSGATVILNFLKNLYTDWVLPLWLAKNAK
jgi:hypothetical protein